MTVLVVTHSEDNTCVPAVTEAIARKGGRAIRFDTDQFPARSRIVARDGDGVPAHVLHTDAGAVDLDAVTAIWYRRIAFGRDLPAAMDPQLQRACRQESQASAMGLLASLRAFALDPVERIKHAEHKQLQLRVARDLGLEIPRTLITNDREAVRAFAASCPGGVVAKMLSSFSVQQDGMEKVVYTTALGPGDLERMDGLEWSPMTFQELVPKAIELRVTVVGDRILAAAVESPAYAGAETDWRRLGPSLADRWQPYAFPAELAPKVLRMMDVFRLNYGAFDFILTPEGRWVFLEVNPAGEFFWLDPVLGGAISDAMADVLLGQAFRRE